MRENAHDVGGSGCCQTRSESLRMTSSTSAIASCKNAVSESTPNARLLNDSTVTVSRYKSQLPAELPVRRSTLPPLHSHRQCRFATQQHMSHEDECAPRARALLKKKMIRH